MKSTKGSLSALVVYLLPFFSIIITSAVASEMLPANFFPPVPGTVIVWKGVKNGEKFNEEHLVGKNSGLLARWKSGDKHFERYGLITFGSPKTFDTSSVDPVWPLKIGNSVSYSRKKGNRKWNDSIKVLGTETITVGAGTFDTFILLFKSKRDNNKWYGQFKAWYAPNVGWAVKREYSDSERKSTKSEVIEIRSP